MLKAELYEWRLNLVTGDISERAVPGMRGVHIEFPTINNAYVGRRNRFGYAAVSIDDTSRPAHVVGAVKVREPAP